MGTTGPTDTVNALAREYVEFLDDEDDQGIYSTRVKHMISEKKIRLIVNINDLRQKNPKRAIGLLKNAFEEQQAFERALKEVVGSVDATYAKEHEDFYVGFEGSFGSRHVTPRTLLCHLLGNMVCVEGIVTKSSMVRLKVVRSVHYCPATNKFMERQYSDFTNLKAFPTSSTYPTTDDAGNLLETEYGLSTYKDHQTISVQEMPEKAPTGLLPRVVDVIVDNDLVDSCQPGDRILIVGNYRCMPSKQGSYTSGIFRTVVIANNISVLSKEASALVTRDDVKRCKRFCKRNDIVDQLSRSIAPSIFGHDIVKKAILCMLLGGVEKILENGTRLRGDINLLLIGDPSVAKSQLLRYVLHTAPRAIATTGRGSSGVGLTAAVTTDPDTGAKTLEAGAMVLADRGIVCIDEFDKMTDIDRTAIHEVMEQGRVTIAKAGIQASLNARCSVMAAANPVYGRYDQFKTPMENIGLQDSLLSRFDLLFVMLDTVDTTADEAIADHVLRMHRYRNPKERDGEVLPLGLGAQALSTLADDPQESEDPDDLIYEKYNPLLHGPSKAKSKRIFSMDFMRKYLFIAKCLTPKLTDQAASAIAEEYASLRSMDLQEHDVARTQPVTARSLETLIRLSTAHAKARLSQKIERIDADAAISLVQYAYFKRVLEKSKKRRKNVESDSENSDEDDDDDEDDDNDNEDDDEAAKKNRTSRQTKRQKTRDDAESVAQAAEAEEEPMDIPVEDLPVLDADRLKLFKTGLTQYLKEKRSQSVSLGTLKAYINEGVAKQQPFTDSEIKSAIDTMTKANQVMLADDILFLI
ncbi:DNA replication licensing factor Mcm3 [Cloeon dipterum]|uniref:DNA replication licensing factor Mcm3 n=1 Tax=Cloeon dipterum TaxID=197152 RepID=UPI00321F959F